MDYDDKLYLWLVIISFVALAAATGFAWAELDALRDGTYIQGGPFT